MFMKCYNFRNVIQVIQFFVFTLKALTFPKSCIYLLQLTPFKNDEKYFYFMSKALFVLKIVKFLP